MLASTAPLRIDPAQVARVLAGHGPISGVASPRDLLEGLVPVTPADVGRARPVRDDLLVYEYYRDPVRELRRLARSIGR